MMNQALEEFQAKHNVKLEKITLIPLEGEGTISLRVAKYAYPSSPLNLELIESLY